MTPLVFALAFLTVSGWLFAYHFYCLNKIHRSGFFEAMAGWRNAIQVLAEFGAELHTISHEVAAQDEPSPQGRVH